MKDRLVGIFENLAQDQNHPVLLDPAAVAVVRAPTARVEDFNDISIDMI